MNQEKYKHRQKKARRFKHVCSLMVVIVTVVLALLPYLLLEPINKAYGALVSIIIAFLGLFIAFLVHDIGDYRTIALEDSESLFKELEKFREDAFPKTAPFGQLSKEFHKTMTEYIASKEYNDSLKWLISKVISRKLSADFINLDDVLYFEKTTTAYSDMLNSLTRECNERIVFNFPYKPREWLDKFTNFPPYDGNGPHTDSRPCKKCKSYTDQANCIIKRWINQEKWIPPHLKAIHGADTNCTHRVVIEEWDVDSDWNGKYDCYADVIRLLDSKTGIISKHPKYMDKYKEFEKRVLSEFEYGIKEEDECDINVFDSIIVVGIIPASDTAVRIPVRMLLNLDNEYTDIGDIVGGDPVF